MEIIEWNRPSYLIQGISAFTVPQNHLERCFLFFVLKFTAASERSCFIWLGVGLRLWYFKSIRNHSKLQPGWGPLILSHPFIFYLRHEGLRSCDALKPLSGGARPEPSTLDFTVNCLPLSFCVLHSRPGVGRLSCKHKRLRSKYFRLCGLYDSLSCTIHLLRKPQNFHFFCHFCVFHQSYSLILFSKGGDGGGEGDYIH